MVEFYATYSKRKGIVYNDQNQFKAYLMPIIVHTKSHETLSTSSDVSQTKISLSKRSINMKIMSDKL